MRKMAASIDNNQTRQAEKKKMRMATTTQKTIISINIALIMLSLIFSVAIYYLGVYKTSQITFDTKNISAIAVLYKCNPSKLNMQITHYSDFWWIKNVYIGERARVADCGDYVTYVTHSKDLSVFDELGTLAKSWAAPISLIIFAPGERFQWAMKAMQYSRNCLPQSNYIREFVSFHIFLPYGETPDSVPHNEEEALAWPYQCKEQPPQASKSALEVFSQNHNNHNHTYPVNVARNLARRAVNSHFVLLSDFTNIPNAEADISSNFLTMLLKKDCYKKESKVRCHLREEYDREVYKLNTYKLKPGTNRPSNQLQLNELKEQSKAQTELLTLPIFIGHRYMPYYDERFYEPQADVHIYLQLYAMCLQGYVFNALPDAYFLTYFERNNTAMENSTDIQNFTDLTMHNLSEEYLPLFGYDSEERCQTCIQSGINCLKSVT